MVTLIQREKEELLYLNDRVLSAQKELSNLLYDEVVISSQIKQLNEAIAEKMAGIRSAFAFSMAE